MTVARSTVRVAAVVGLGLLALLAALAVGVGAPQPGADAGPTAVGILAVLVGLAVAWRKLRRPPDDATVESAPWTEDGAIVADPPERTPEDVAIAGTALTERIERAARRARSERTVQAGLEPVREAVRPTLVAALVDGGLDPDEASRRVATGEWTDDREAAAVLDSRVRPPERSLRRRVWAWLYPERAVRRRSARAVAAVADAADEALPPVVGQRAPRPVTVADPSIAELGAATDSEPRRSPREEAARDDDGATGDGDSATGNGDGATGDGDRTADVRADAGRAADGDPDPAARSDAGAGRPSDGGRSRHGAWPAEMEAED